MKNRVTRMLAVAAVALSTLGGVAHAWCGSVPYRHFPPPPTPDWHTNVAIDASIHPGIADGLGWFLNNPRRRESERAAPQSGPNPRRDPRTKPAQ
jgi:hypothetical protein